MDYTIDHVRAVVDELCDLPDWPAGVTRIRPTPVGLLVVGVGGFSHSMGEAGKRWADDLTHAGFRMPVPPTVSMSGRGWFALVEAAGAVADAEQAAVVRSLLRKHGFHAQTEW